MLEQFFGMGLAEWLAVLLALAYLLLAIRQNPWCWACAAASALIYLVVFARAGLQMQSALQLFYIAMAAYGWYAWRGGPGATARRPVSRWPVSRHLAAAALVLAAALANGYLIGRGREFVPYLDALIAWASVLTTWMVAQKLLENWLYWIVIDLVAAALYWSLGLYPTALLFLLYAAIAVRGYSAWKQSMDSDTGNVARMHA
jgi:nicotinamide mononucleotide transporter